MNYTHIILGTLWEKPSDGEFILAQEREMTHLTVSRFEVVGADGKYARVRVMEKPPKDIVEQYAILTQDEIQERGWKQVHHPRTRRIMDTEIQSAREILADEMTEESK